MTAADPPTRAPSLETIGMSKAFGALRALHDVSIQIPARSFHALLGENSAGKSTLVKCVMGFHTPDRGQLLLNGSEVAGAQSEGRAGARNRDGLAAFHPRPRADCRRKSGRQPR
jgi:ABC-type sugar transport system ATPase subunit